MPSTLQGIKGRHLRTKIGKASMHSALSENAKKNKPLQGICNHERLREAEDLVCLSTTALVLVGLPDVTASETRRGGH